MTKVLFFIESPLHLLNAFEAVHTFKYTKYQYIIRLSSKEMNDKQLVNLTHILNIEEDKIQYIDIRDTQKTLKDYVYILWYGIKYLFVSPNKQVFIGNHTSGFLKVIMRQFKLKNIILLDDGAKTLSIQKGFTKENFYNLFTMYRLDKVEGQKIFKNEYIETKARLKELVRDSKKILFLGTKLSEFHIIKESYYLSLMRKFSERYKDKTIIYIPHREENKEKIKQLEKFKNLKIKYVNYPIELYGVYETVIPSKVSSFYSTALFTMQNIYGIEAESIKFNYSQSKHKAAIDEVYDYYKNEMAIIDLD